LCWWLADKGRQGPRLLQGNCSKLRKRDAIWLIPTLPKDFTRPAYKLRSYGICGAIRT